MVFWNKDLLFCDINPTCYAISLKKEILKRHLQNLSKKNNFAKKIDNEKLVNLVSGNSSNMIKRADGVNLESQFNKATNIKLACEKINGILIKPGEIFSFWHLVGKMTEKKGYKAGRVIEKNKLVLDIGGGICNLANTIHLLVVHSPMEIIEFHTHSDALVPEKGERIPLNSGTSISYNNLDYRFINKTNQTVQLILWCDGEVLRSELRSESEFPLAYRIVEEDHHFKKEGSTFYRNSKIYREVIDKKTTQVIGKDLIWNNHSEVMYDYNLIPQELIE